MVICQLKERPIVCAGADGQQVAHLVLGEERDLRWYRDVLSSFHASDSLSLLGRVSRLRGSFLLGSNTVQGPYFPVV
jgi:hypothetical protein